ncbi:MAG: hypothetical protein V4632_20725 [Pseudomonadota bacterium]
MHIVAVGWMYVVFMMSITEESAVAGIMTFLLYGVFPLAIILYITGSGRRKRRRAAAESRVRDDAKGPQTPTPQSPPGTNDQPPD